jgi:hypothetical protein
MTRSASHVSTESTHLRHWLTIVSLVLLARTPITRPRQRLAPPVMQVLILSSWLSIAPTVIEESTVQVVPLRALLALPVSQLPQ